MKHASEATLRELEGLLVDLRKLPGMVERKPGIFYRRSQAFLHFHEDPAGLFADAKIDGASFARFGVSSPAEIRHFLAAVRGALGVQG